MARPVPTSSNQIISFESFKSMSTDDLRAAMAARQVVVMTADGALYINLSLAYDAGVS